MLAFACKKTPDVLLDSEVDYQDDEDDEVGRLLPVPYGAPRYGGHAVANPLCSTETPQNPGVDMMLRQAWHTSRMVDDPKVLEESAAHARDALKKEPRSARAALLLASALAKHGGRNKEALRNYETFILSCPTTIDAHRTVTLLQRYEHRRETGGAPPPPPKAR